MEAVLQTLQTLGHMLDSSPAPSARGRGTSEAGGGGGGWQDTGCDSAGGIRPLHRFAVPLPHTLRYEGGVHLPDTRQALLGHQQPPPEDPAHPWRAWLLLGGRGSGKTYAGARWLTQRALDNPGGQFALLGATLHDVREVMIEGRSGLKAAAPPGHRPDWSVSRRRLEWKNGAVAYGFSAEDPDSLRGPQFHAAWVDEFCAFAHPATALDMLRFGLRLGDDPRLVITTTPKPIKALRDLIAQAGVSRTAAATHLNAANLAPGFIDHLLALHGGTRLAAQEIEGLLVESDSLALWRAEQLAACRGARPPSLDRIVLALDPNITARGDACGMVLAGRREGRAYVLADLSQAGLTPAAWAVRAVAAAREHGAGCIVAEANQGGEMVRALLAQAQAGGQPIPLKLVHAKLGKRGRAEPVAALYEQGRVTHCGAFPALEEEMMAMGEDGAGSLDRADALVWALTELMLVVRREPRIRVL